MWKTALTHVKKPRNIYVCMYILPCYDVHTLLSRAEVMELEATITEGQNWSAVYYHTHTLLSFTLVNRLN